MPYETQFPEITGRTPEVRTTCMIAHSHSDVLDGGQSSGPIEFLVDSELIREFGGRSGRAISPIEVCDAQSLT